MIYNTQQARNLLGHCCNDLDLLRDRNYIMGLNDFEDRFHKVLFGALQNLSLEKDIKQVDGFALDDYLKKFPVQYELFKQNKGVEFVETVKELVSTTSFDYSYKTVKKYSLLRRFASIGMDIREILDINTIDVVKIQEQQNKLEKLTLEEIKQHFKAKLIEVDQEFQSNTDTYCFSAGDDIEELLLMYQNGEHWGRSFKSKYFNTIFRGAQGSKFLISSGGTGTGKSRQMLGQACEISCEKLYDPKGKEWVYNKKVEDSVFISSELTKEELQLAFLSTISGVAEETIKSGKYTVEVFERLKIAKEVLKVAKIHCEYTSNFSISEIENIIEKHIIRNNARFVFFDYIQITSNLSQELNKLFGYTLREDQMLNQLSTALKTLANKYNVFIWSATQLNRSYKTDTYLDSTHLRGGMATADKCDYVVITLKVSKTDLEKLNPIIEARGFGAVPTHAQHIVKNRGGKWNGVVVWVNMDLDTINVEDCFVTTQDFELISNISLTKLK